ncbi:ATP-binding protein [Fimbriimonas ginsengisoli]|nr:tetratricopeptide repeat protein [Fimbriimonas ginsengisoli]
MKYSKVEPHPGPIDLPKPIGFLCHAGEDAWDGRYLAEFTRRLVARVRARLGPRMARIEEDGDVLFADWRDNRVGQDYLVRHSEKLARCGCLVAVLSPSFFRVGSESAKELLAFLDRIGSEPVEGGYTGLVPVVWGEFEDVDLLEGALQNAHRTLSASAKERQAPTLLKLIRDQAQNAAVEEALDQYADAIIASASVGLPVGKEERIRHFLDHGSAPMAPAVQVTLETPQEGAALPGMEVLLSLGARGKFVGYEDMIARVVEWAERGEPPMLLLHGPGGIGKTSTAVEAIKRIQGRFAGGVHVARFDVLTTNVPEDVTADSFASMLAEAVRAPEVVRKDPSGSLAGYLARQGTLLLFLDNFESVANTQTNAFLGNLLQQARNVRALATSQHAASPLNVTAEVKQRSLGVPTSEDNIEGSEAFTLFRDRSAQRGVTEFSDLKALLRVLRATEGLPLALELLGAHANDATLKEIADGVEKAALSWLQTSGEDSVGVARQRSIEACVSWSIDRLKKKDREAFLKLAPFEYPFVADDAELHLKVSRSQLTEWTRWSLLRRTEVHGASEYELPTIVRLVLAKRAEISFEAMRRAYCGYYVGLVRERGNEMPGSPGWNVLRRASQPAARAIVEGTVPPGLVLACFYHLGEFLRVTSRNDDARTVFERGLITAMARPDKSAQANARIGLAEVASIRNAYAEAEEGYRAALAIYKEVGNRHGEPNALRGLADVASMRGAYAEAEEGYRAAQILYKEIGDRQGEAHALKALADMAKMRDAYPEAEEGYRLALSINKETGDQQGEAHALRGIADVAKMRDAYSEAEEGYRAALTIYKEVGNRHGEANALVRIADVTSLRGAYCEAEEGYRAAQIIYKGVGSPSGEANALDGLANVARMRGAYSEAKEGYRAALTIFKKIGDRRGEANVLGGLAEVARVRDAYAEAEEGYRAAQILYKEIGDRQGEAGSLYGFTRTRIEAGRDDIEEAGLQIAGEFFQKIGDKRNEAIFWALQMRIRGVRGDAEEAARELRAVRGELAQVEGRFEEAEACLWLGDFEPDVEAKRRAWDDALGLFRSLPNRHFAGEANLRLAGIAGSGEERAAYLAAAREDWESSPDLAFLLPRLPNE